jgi:hypothetical protein
VFSLLDYAEIRCDVSILVIVPTSACFGVQDTKCLYRLFVVVCIFLQGRQGCRTGHRIIQFRKYCSKRKQADTSSDFLDLIQSADWSCLFPEGTSRRSDRLPTQHVSCKNMKLQQEHCTGVQENTFCIQTQLILDGCLRGCSTV